MPTSRTVLRWSILVTCGVLGVLLVAYGVYLIRSILVLVLIALFLAISFEPVVRWLEGKGVPRGPAVAIVLSVLVLAVAGFVWSVVPLVVQQGGHLFDNLPGYVTKFSEESKAVREVTDRYHVTDRLTALAAALPGKLAGGAVGFFQQFAGTVTSCLTVLVLTIYFMGDLPRLRRGLLTVFPPARRHRVGEIVDVTVDKVGGYMIGNIIISVIAGTTSFLALEALRVPFALPLAVTVAIADLIPMIGATLGAAICVLVSLFTVGLWPRTLLLVLFFVLYQLAENYLLVPRIFRNTVDMPAAAVLLVALTGGTLLGLAGVIMAIPVAATVKVVVAPLLAARVPPPDTPAVAADAAAPPPDPETGGG